MKYLTSYGYIPASDIETGNLRSDDYLKEAIKTLQSFGNIPATGVVDKATADLMERPRCGVTDIPAHGSARRKRFTIYSGPPWNHNDLTWSLRTQHLEDLVVGEVRRDLHAALNIWSQDSNLTFQEVNSDDADILVKFHRKEHGDGYAFDGRGRVLAHAFFPNDGDRGGDVHFDEDEDWILEYQYKRENGEGTRLLMVAAHEFGHSLGLSHSSDPTSLMFPWYQSLGDKFVLPDDDRSGIQQLYGARSKWATIPKYQPAGGQQPWKPNYTPVVKPTYRPSSRTVTPPSRPTTTTTYKPIHRHHHHSTHKPYDGAKPNTCNTSYDAVSIIRRETFIFKDSYMWRLGDKGLMGGYPAPIVQLWRSLPNSLTHVDAVYERLDKNIVFFIGRQMYVFDGVVLVGGSPKPLTSLGLSPLVDHIDAALVWGHNSKTYLFSGTNYWRLDTNDSQIELDYPRDIGPVWKGMGSHFDAAFQWKDGKTYFFKNKRYWKFNDMKMAAENKQPLPSAAFWMNCTADKTTDLIESNGIPTESEKQMPRSKGRIMTLPDIQDQSQASSFTHSNNIYVYVLLILFHLLPR